MSSPLSVVPMINLNPLSWLGDKVAEGAASAFTSMMMGLWSASMWLLKTVFAFMDSFTPNIQDPGLNRLYGVTLWISLVIALIIGFGQIALSVIRQDGKSLAALALGVIQYGAVVSCWLVVGAAFITGSSGLTKGILNSLLSVDSFSGYGAGDGWVDSVSGTVEAAALGVTGLFVVVPAAFGHLIIMMVRAAALLILTATMPIAAAGALGEGTKSWMWKSIRWFLACVLLEPLLALVLGMGVQFAWSGMPDGAAENGSSTPQNIGASVVGSVIMLVACFTPMALFRLFAFVDPGTASGASFRTTMNANGGVSGLIRGHGGGQPTEVVASGGGSGAASEAGPDGRSSSENGAEAQTANRWQSKAAGAVGMLGRGAGKAMHVTGRIAEAGARAGVDVMGQAGAGTGGYYGFTPDQSSSHHGGRFGRTPLGPAQQEHRHAEEDAHPSSDGVANDLPPQTQVAIEDGAFFE